MTSPVLVTGGAGYVGSAVCRALVEDGRPVRVLDDLSRGHRASLPEDAELVRGDVCDPGVLDRALDGVDGICHLAARAYVGESMRSPGPYWQTNLEGTLALLEGLSRHGVERLVHASTCAVYGVPDDVPIPESHPCRPRSPYGRSKRAAEWAIDDHARSGNGLAWVALRFFNAAGAWPDGSLGEDHDPETHLVPRAIAAALGRRGPLPLLGTDHPTPDGTCVRDFVHVADLARAHVRALEHLESHPDEGIHLNLGTGRGHSVREVLETVGRVTGREVPTEDAPRRPGDPPTLVADATRATRVLDWAPRHRELASIVETAVAWHREHPEGYGGRG